MKDRSKDILNSINETLINIAQKKYKDETGIKKTKADDYEETPEIELEEYKKDFYNMSVGSLKAIMQHSNNILNSLENPTVSENLTAAHLQGTIAIVEDQMRSIHDFVMYVSESDDTSSGAKKPGLWENIRKKKEREGKKYKPAKPGDKDYPDPESYKKAQ